MQKIIFLLSLLVSVVYGDSNLSAGKLFIYKTTDKTLELNTIKSRHNLFEDILDDEKFDDNNATYWIQLRLNKGVASGEYVVICEDIDFDLSSMQNRQNLHKISLGYSNSYSFFYDKSRDAKVYYFRLVAPKMARLYTNFTVLTIDNFYKKTTEYFYYLFICGVIIGLIMMTALYNGAVYYYNKEKSFLYYALMQLFIALTLMYATGLVEYSTQAHKVQFDMLNLIGFLFATLFTRAFFDTSRYLNKWNKILYIYIFIIVLDMLYLFIIGESIVSKFKLFSILGLIYLVIGYIRYKQGFKPAKFFLIGWSALILSIFLTEYFERYIGLSLLLLGSAIEAILLAVALAYNIKLINDEKEQQKELMVHQSKLASMGEMIGNIAHQWRQPLAYLSYNFMTLKEAGNQNILDSKFLNKKLDEATTQLEFMSQTIDDFKDFYAPNKDKELFSLSHATEQTLELMENSLQHDKIEVKLNILEDIEIENYKNEYKQVLLNLLANAKDVLVQRDIKTPKINITINKKTITISDNAGGIDIKIITRIFEPYFSTKEGSSGIGLYMSKMIVEKNMGGVLKVENDLEGAVFTLVL